ncbi:MAG: helix-turn-helix domain-containing protein [Phycisphaerales bacterium]|nr:helix-turn-helix domain-containing protein [Phycisphaerales bacterium]
MPEHTTDAQTTDTPATEPVPRLALRPIEAAAALGLSPRKLWEITADARSGIPVVRFGKAILYPTRELADWLCEQCKQGARR